MKTKQYIFKVKEKNFLVKLWRCLLRKFIFCKSIFDPSNSGIR